MSVLEDLCETIRGNEIFQSEFNSLLEDDMRSQFGVDSLLEISDDAIRRLLQSATLFAQSTRTDARQLAYRIVISSSLYRDRLKGAAHVARLVLARLGNYPAINLAFAGQIEPRSIPQTAFFEMLGRQQDNTVQILGHDTTFTDLQLSVWSLLIQGKSVALSAPTSAGKSYLFQSYIRYMKTARPRDNIVYLVPSRALINQVSNELARRTEGAPSLPVVSVPVVVEVVGDISPTYVLTPERLQVILQSSPTISFHVAIVDEAHLIGEGSRGIILQSVLQEIQRRNAGLQLLFSSPQVRDPEVFARVIDRSGVAVVKTEDTPVAQNIFLIKGRAEDPRNLSIYMWRAGQEIMLGDFDVPMNLLNSEDRLIYLSWLFGRGSQSLIYASGPASSENTAIKLSNLAAEEAVSSGAAVLEQRLQAREYLSDFAKEAVHPSFILVDTVLNGVAFHYGRLPTLLRHAIEEEFDKGNLESIVCTSTLLQGINLPARNIFMENPLIGDDIPLDPVDFWNLAGRAGRLGKDFQGNVFLIDYDRWDSKPLEGDRDQAIVPSLEACLSTQAEEFLAFVESDNRPSGENEEFEAAFAKVFRDYKADRLEQTLAGIAGLTDQNRSRLFAGLRNAADKISIDPDVLDQSPQISGFRQQDLYDYMKKRITGKGPEYLIPLHPNADFTDGLNKLRPVFARVHKYLEFKSNRSHMFWAPLALRWMRGEPLPQLIDGAIRYHKTRSKRTVIREVLSQVENDLRFRYVKLIGCYVSILKRALQDSGHPQFVERIPALPLYLELGAASRTMISLIGLGLSRLTSWRLAEQTLNREMDGDAARRFVRSLNLERIGLSPFILSEVRRVIE